MDLLQVSLTGCGRCHRWWNLPARRTQRPPDAQQAAFAVMGSREPQMIGHVQTDVVGMPKDPWTHCVISRRCQPLLPGCPVALVGRQWGYGPYGHISPAVRPVSKIYTGYNAMGGRNASENLYPVGCSCAVCGRISVNQLWRSVR